MQKKLLALAVAGALSAPLAAQADSSNVQIYGVLQPSINRVDNGHTTGTSMADNASRIGFRGSEDLGNGLKAIFQLESAVSPDERNGTWTGRDSWAGLSSATWGTVKFGAMFTAYKSSTNYVDPLGDTVADYNNIVSRLHGANLFDNRTNNAIQYTSPKFGGFQVDMTYGMGANGGKAFESQGNDTNRSIALSYKAGPLTLTAAHERSQRKIIVAGVSEDDSAKATKLSAGYKIGSTALALMYAREDAGDSAPFRVIAGGKGLSAGAIKNKSRDRNVIHASVKHSMGNIDLMGAYTWADDLDGVKKSGAQQFGVGAAYNFSKRTNVGIYYAYLDNDRNATQSLASVGGGVNPADQGDKIKAFSVQMKHNF